MDKNAEPFLIRIDDYLLNVDIIGTNSDGTLAIEYRVISKNEEVKIDHDHIGAQLNIFINKILEEYMNNVA